MTQTDSVYILIPVYNRRVTTLCCLEALQHNGDLARYSVVVIDDGSTDGTAEAIRSTYPTVTVLPGNGNLWWTGAIAKGMKYAYERGADYFIWLNDDTLPSSSAIHQMLSACATSPNLIISAQCYADDTYLKPTYGGRNVRGFSLQFLAAQKEDLLECDVCSGNLVCLPRSVVEAIGYPPGHQVPQAWGDVVYTWAAKQSGFEIKVLGAATAICPTNELEEGWSSSSISMGQRWRLLNSPKSSIYPPAYWFYCQRVYGYLGAIPFIQVYLKLAIFSILRLFIPLRWITGLKRLKDHHSSIPSNIKDPKY